MTHAEEQTASREAKRLRRERTAALSEENRIRTARLKHTVYIDVDHDYMCKLLSDVLPEDTETIEVIIPNGKSGWSIRVQRRIK